MTFVCCNDLAPSSATRFKLLGHVPGSAAVLMLGVSAAAMLTGHARADCQPDPATAGPDLVICDSLGADNSDYSALGGDDTIFIIGGTYAGGIFGADGNDAITLSGVAADVNLIFGNAGNDTIDLTLGTVSDDVFGDSGDDIITLLGATVTDDIFGGSGNDTIDLLGGSVGGNVFGSGGGGNNTITLDGAAVTGSIFAGSADDTVILDSGTVGGVDGQAGNDTITLAGATVGAGIIGNGGNDTINMLSGSTSFANGNDGNDTITLNGAIVTGNINSGAGEDTVNILSGMVNGDVNGQADNDTITLNGGTVGGNVNSGTGDDTVTLDGATVTGFIFADTGNDTINLLSGMASAANGSLGDDTITLDGATVTGNIFGVDGTDTISLLSGLVGGIVGAGSENDTIVLDGATITGAIFGDEGNDAIALLGGSAFDVNGNSGNDSIILDGASIGNDIDAGNGDDVVTLLSGIVGNDVDGHVGVDTITLVAATVTGDIIGGGGNDIIDILLGSASNVLGGFDDDSINLLGGTVGAVDGEGGNDTITLNGGDVTGDIHGGDDDDTINLLAGTVGGSVFGDVGPGDDTILLDGAVVLGNIDGEAGNDTITLLSGLVGGQVLGGTGADTITLDGATVTDDIRGDAGNDTITLLSGLAGDDVSGGAGDDTITINGATVGFRVFGGTGNDTVSLISGLVTNDISGDAGNDTITLLGGVAGDDVSGEDGNDIIVLNGAIVANRIFGGSGDDVFLLTSGTFGGSLLGGTGSDTATFNPTYSLATISGNLDGGDNVSAADGWVDVLNIEASGALIGNNVINWETINVNSADLTLLGTGLTTGQDGIFGLGMSLNGLSTLDFDDSFALTGDLQVFGGSTLIAEDGAGTYSISGYVINDGTIDMSDGIGPNDVLTVNGTYDTLGADLLLDAALDSTEDGDLLVLNGAIVNNGGNQTFLTITDTNPSGDPSFTGTGAGNGIPLVDNSGGFGIVDTDFVFDPFTHPTNEILKVPFVYTLSLESDDIVYLQSDVLAQVYGYAILSEMMRDQFPTLRDRLGDMRYNGYDSEGNPELGLDNAGLWARIDGSKRDIEHDGGHNTGEWNDTRGEASIGIDIPMETFGGVGVFGVSIHAVRGYADANSGLTPDPNVAEVDTTGFGGGLSFAWFPGGGFYADVQGRVTGWDADVENEARDLKQDIDGLGWGASLEVGNRFQIASNTAIIPRGQVVYTDVDFDSFKDDDGVDVSQDDSASVVIGPGVTIEQMFPDNGVAMFLDASVKHELLDESSIDASGFRFKSGLEDTWGTVSFGASLGVAEGASAYVAGDVSSPLTSTFGDSYGYGLRAGVRIDF